MTGEFRVFLGVWTNFICERWYGLQSMGWYLYVLLISVLNYILVFRNEEGKTGMIPMSYVEDIPEEEQYQEVPSDDSWTDNEDGKTDKDSTIKRLPDNSPSETASAVSEIKENLETSDSKSQVSENPPQSVGDTNG